MPTLAEYLTKEGLTQFSEKLRNIQYEIESTQLNNLTLTYESDAKIGTHRYKVTLARYSLKKRIKPEYHDWIESQQQKNPQQVELIRT